MCSSSSSSSSSSSLAPLLSTIAIAIAMPSLKHKPKRLPPFLSPPSSPPPRRPRSRCLLLLLLPSLLLCSSFLPSSRLLTYKPRLGGVRILAGRQLFRTHFLHGETQDGDEDFYCDRLHLRTDVCRMKGDVRVNGQFGSIRLCSPERDVGIQREERIRPYTRKWETSVMSTIDEVSLQRVGNSTEKGKLIPRCDVQHTVPAIVFSTGGYTGNVYHEFNDGLIPLFISSQHLKGEVVFMILEYHDWWMTKYSEIVGQLTNHEVVDFTNDKRVHCFPEITIGLNIHDELHIDPKLTEEGVSMRDFQGLLHRAYLPTLQIRRAQTPGESTQSGRPSEDTTTAIQLRPKRPKLELIARESPRAILNQQNVTSLAEKIGFDVEILSPKPTMEMVDLYAILNSADVMIGVHGAAMTHLLFMRPGSIFIQVVPLGTDWAALTYYGEPARKLGLQYVEYKITPRESSLSDKYAMDDPVLTDPDSVNQKGWWETKKVYLEGQDVRISLARFKRILRAAYKSTV